MFRGLYAWMLRLAARPDAPWWLAAVSFAESSCFPLPPDPLLLVMALARPQRAWRLAAICSLASVLGGMLGYYIGYALFDVVARPIIHAYHGEAGFDRVRDLYAAYGFWFIIGKGFLPIPYKIVTIASGAFHFDFGLFVLASALTRGIRFFLIAAIVWRFGDGARDWIERRLTWVMGGGFAALILGFVLIRYI